MSGSSSRAADSFRRPLGLFLQGGGALGAWQAGALEALDAAGLRFDAVMGYSIGAVNGAALAFGRLPEALARWRKLDGRALRPRLSLRPFALFSPEPLREFLSPIARDEAAAKSALKIDLTVVSACRADDAPINARFSPGGRAWDEPLLEHAAASCAIPFVFPSVAVEHRGRRLVLHDGGVPTARPLDFSPLSRCADVIVLEMVRADEVGRRVPLWRRHDQRGREAGRRLVDGGLAGLTAGSDTPRALRLSPSKRLGPSMLDFREKGLKAMLAQGGRDAREFLARVSAS